MKENLLHNQEAQNESPEAFLRRMRKTLEKIAEEGE
jgi:hypothetical protein